MKKCASVLWRPSIKYGEIKKSCRMKILLYSYTFLPALGGIEVVSATLAEHLVSLGHQCSVVTETASDAPDSFTYQVFRQPSFKERIALVRSHDIVHSNGASMALFFYAKLSGKPFMWTHGGYQLSCIDGLGWVDGEKAPLNPWESLKFHRHRSGLAFAVKEGFKLALRRWVGKRVAANVAVTHWVAKRQPLPHQVVIYNPFPLEKFVPSDKIPKIYDFIYLGRIVSEKGVPVLLHAFSILVKKNDKLSLAIIGDGNWKEKMEMLARELGIEANTFFMGKKSGKELTDAVLQAKIAVIPSLWEEPMGGVALEMMSAGLNVIVSKNGGLAECVGKAGLVFDNGNERQLADCMEHLHQDTFLQALQKSEATEQLIKFLPVKLVEEYVSLYESLLKN
jgi:glycosyltransferase involved in cell wall biosynthesis